MILRCFNKIIRHFYNAYTAMDLKFEVYAIDYIRMTSFYITYPLEYLMTQLLVIYTIPIIKYALMTFTNNDFNIELAKLAYLTCLTL